MTTDPPAWAQREVDGVTFFEQQAGNVRLGFTTRLGGVSTGAYGSLNLSFNVGDEPGAVAGNRARACRALDLGRLATVRQVHGDRVVAVGGTDLPGEDAEADALCTDAPGIGIGVKVADCLPVFIFHPEGRCAGIAHCGWRGTAAGLGPKLARAMSDRYRVPVRELSFSLGPCISPGRYPVGEDALGILSQALPAGPGFLRPASDPPHDRWLLDLRAANRALLRELGLNETAGIEHCTWTEGRLFYSARREHVTGRNLAAVVIRG